MTKAFQHEGQTWTVEPSGTSTNGNGISRCGASFYCPALKKEVRGWVSPIGIERLSDDQLSAALTGSVRLLERRKRQ